MEQIIINITGQGSERQAAALMKAFYKTMAKMDGGRCHVTLNTEHIGLQGDGVSIPQFMQEGTRQPGQYTWG